MSLPMWTRMLVPASRHDLDELRSLIMSLADDYALRLNAATNELATELAAVRAAIQTAATAGEANVQLRIAEALSLLDAPISALERMGQDNTDLLPGPADPTPIPAPSEGQVDAGAPIDPNATEPRTDEPFAGPLSADQVNTSLDGNAPHTQPDGSFSSSVAPVEMGAQDGAVFSESGTVTEVPADEPVSLDEQSDVTDPAPAESTSRSRKGK